MNRNQNKHQESNNLSSLFFSQIEPFENSEMSKLEDDYKYFIVDPATRLQDMALENKMESITNEINNFKNTLNNELENINEQIKNNDEYFQDDLEMKLNNLRSTNSNLEQTFQQNLINSHAAKTSYQNERSMYRKNLVQSFVYGTTLVYMGILMYRAFK